jgi:hypothetical protein
MVTADWPTLTGPPQAGDRSAIVIRSASLIELHMTPQAPYFPAIADRNARVPNHGLRADGAHLHDAQVHDTDGGRIVDGRAAHVSDGKRGPTMTSWHTSSSNTDSTLQASTMRPCDARPHNRWYTLSGLTPVCQLTYLVTYRV